LAIAYPITTCIFHVSYQLQNMEMVSYEWICSQKPSHHNS
jgi:hypothetical protein